MLLNVKKNIMLRRINVKEKIMSLINLSLKNLLDLTKKL